MLLDDVPNDLIRCVCGFLDFKDILKLELVSKRFSNSLQYATEINLSYTYLPDKIKQLSSILKRCKSLRTFEIFETGLSTEDFSIIVESIKHLRFLKTLDVGNNDILKSGNISLSEVLQFNHLKVLSISHTRMTTNEYITLSNILDKQCSLESLDLDSNEIGDEGLVPLFKALKKHSYLKRLDIDNNDMSKKGCIALSELLKEIPIEYLRISSNNIGPYECKIICEGLIHQSSLKHLDISYNHSILGVDGCNNLVNALKHHKYLENLELYGCNLNDEYCIILSELLKDNHYLKELELSENEISDVGCITLAKALKKSKLTHLNIGSNRIGDNGCIALSKLFEQKCSIKHLAISNNNINTRGCVRLADTLVKQYFKTTLYHESIMEDDNDDDDNDDDDEDEDDDDDEDEDDDDDDDDDDYQILKYLNISGNNNELIDYESNIGLKALNYLKRISNKLFLETGFM